MNEKLFLDLCLSKGYDPKVIAKLQKAIAISREALSSKKRLTGDSFFDHNLRVAAILIENGSLLEVILAGILHGTIPKLSPEEIKREFGDEILSLVTGEDDIRDIKLKNRSMDPEALRRVIFTTMKDVRVIVLTLANKLDNLRTISPLPVAEQKRIAEGVLEVYGPLAYRLGMDKMKNDLEDIAFKIINPQKYLEIASFLKASHEEREKDITDIITHIKKIAAGQAEILKIKGRPKHIYGIYKKIAHRKVKLDEQYDLLGVRVIVPEVKDCYTILGLLHEKLEPVEGRLKDYLANPKPNFYRSIHTAIKMANGQIVEVQIRTPEMDEFAEEGIAAHWRYKGVKSEQTFEKKISWLRSILQLEKDSPDLIEAAKVDVFGDEIYCYTPKGDVKELPKGATVLDFSYAVHEEIGQKTVGGRVNGKFVPLKHELQFGDVVEIITNKHQHPHRSWVKIVKSGRARQKIRKFLAEHEKLPAIHYNLLKPLVREDLSILAISSELPNATCILAKCCQPLPGQLIKGIITKRRIISVHHRECHTALKEEPRWIEVQWKETFNQKIKFFALASERSGLLADLLHTIARAGFEVSEAKAKLIDMGNALCSFTVIPRDLEQLKDLVKRVQKVNGVLKVYFE